MFCLLATMLFTVLLVPTPHNSAETGGDAPSQLAMNQLTVGNFTTEDACFTTPSRSLFYAQDLWWAFCSEGYGIVYRTSAHGNEWASSVAMQSSGSTDAQETFSVWVKGSTLYYVVSGEPDAVQNMSGQYFLYRYGNLDPNGSITWSIAEMPVQTEYPTFSRDTLTVDSAGDAWAAIQTLGNNTINLEVYRNSGNGTAWVRTKVVSGGFESSIPLLVPLSSGIALIYGGGPSTSYPDSPIYVTTTSDEGETWTTPVSPSSPDYYMAESSATSVGDTFYFIGPTLVPSWELQFWTFTIGSNSTSAETTLASYPVADSISESGGVLVVTYSTGNGVYERESDDFGGHWGEPQTISANDSYAISMTSTFSGAYAAIWPGEVWNGSQQVSQYVSFYTAENTMTSLRDPPNQNTSGLIAISTPSSRGGSGTPELSVLLGFALLVTAAIVVSYVVARRITLPRTGAKSGTSET